MPSPVPTLTRAVRALPAVLLAVLLMAVTWPAAAMAAGPQPTSGYQPAFVTEREAGPWEDCIWASAAMFLDKWTSGGRIVDRKRLRALSGDHEGGSSLADVRRAFTRIGMRLTWSPRGGASVGWPALLDRLARGGGALLLGDYGKLPERFGRWDRTFWSRTGPYDDHALYLDRYDRRTGQILVMDPLAPAGWSGEWFPLAALKRFAWRTAGGSLWTALTPPARVLAPFEGVLIGRPTALADETAVHVTWPVEGAPAGWTHPGAVLTTDLAPLAGVDPALPILQARPAPAAGVAPTNPSTRAADGVLGATVPLPSTPGLYRLAVGLADPNSGQQRAGAGPYSLYVPGPRAATYTAPDHLVLQAGEQARIPIDVANTGTESWADPLPVGWLAPDAQRGPTLRLIGTWLWRPSASSEPGTGVPTPILSAAAGVLPGSLNLDAGEQRALVANLQVPADPGTWLLLLDLIDNRGWSLAAAGSAPAIITVEVLPDGTAPGSAIMGSQP